MCIEFLRNPDDSDVIVCPSSCFYDLCTNHEFIQCVWIVNLMDQSWRHDEYWFETSSREASICQNEISRIWSPLRREMICYIVSINNKSPILFSNWVRLLCSRPTLLNVVIQNITIEQTVAMWTPGSFRQVHTSFNFNRRNLHARIKMRL